ncbi:UNVERIFIED_CONTAM: hypothetical protein Sradi_6234000 [Sesamum radiatum]|uniref:Reverse transcriptase domain-containing protein n=1 Tax=Sesamum radiatum TaxID=300843 RepID=A0AAW2K9Y3_SESRA
MPFGLKFTGATYQRLVNRMFKDQIGITMEVYVDSMVVKSLKKSDHLTNLEESLQVMKKYSMKLNTIKCTFGVGSGTFIGYLIIERGIEANFKNNYPLNANSKVCKRHLEAGKENVITKQVSF